MVASRTNLRSENDMNAFVRSNDTPSETVPSRLSAESSASATVLLDCYTGSFAREVTIGSKEASGPLPQSGGGDITQLLRRFADGDSDAFDRLVPLVYEDLRQIAHRQLRRLRPGRTLDTTGLVHEAYLKLIGSRAADWNDRSHFFAVAAAAMRQILVDHARYLTRAKRGGNEPNLELDESRLRLVDDASELLDLDHALERLARSEPRQVRVIECRYFAGFTVDETAAALGVARRTVHRDWLQAQAWLRQELGESQEAD